MALYVHREVLAALDSSRLRFAFGKFGRCALRLAAAPPSGGAVAL